ncbi:hypothetical protein [Fredinandcohnia onubensis]|uniref:hypothetical protein n=1 Tax=Fredinandcohnia onubensis TaxID=1571209 RepID=UPI000C0BEA29|nr:hypothetical protein [Fredinandcohnia onubensis]
MAKQWNLELAKEEFEKLSLTLLATKFKNTSTEMDYLCNICGHTDKKTLGKVVYRKQGCPKCGKKKAGVSKRLSIETVKEELLKRKVRLLSTDYVKRTLPIKFECNLCKKEDERTYASIIKSEFGCLDCGEIQKRKNLIKYTIKDAKKIFLEVGLDLTEKEYKSFHEELLYECIECGYKNNKSLANAKSGKGCPKCAGILPLEFEEVKELFAENNLLLNEKAYINAHTSMKYICLLCGYMGDKTVSNLKAGKGCRGCADNQISENQRLPYKEVKEFIESKGWRLVSTTYEKASEKLHLRCPENHTVFMKFNNFKSGKRCRKCSGLESPTLEERQSIFLKLNLTLLDFEYKNGNSPLRYQCQECNYVGYKTYKSAKNGFGCLSCSPQSVGEERIAVWLSLNNIKYIRQFTYLAILRQKSYAAWF